ncbi:MAG TPA: VanZ family protein [Bacteroidetes bacterium]|nr:VanZ family protein [Bacteroidota bacterium]
MQSIDRIIFFLKNNTTLRQIPIILHLAGKCYLKNRHLKPYFPALICAIVIFVLSTTGSVQLPDVGLSPDKVGHLAAYGTLSWLVFWGLKKSGKLNRENMIWTVLGASIYGASLEFVQWAFFPHRFFEVWDMVANSTGACLSYFAFKFFTNKT